MSDQPRQLKILAIASASEQADALSKLSDAWSVHTVLTWKEFFTVCDKGGWDAVISPFYGDGWDIFNVAALLQEKRKSPWLAAIGKQVSGEAVARFMEIGTECRYFEARDDQTLQEALITWLNRAGRRGMGEQSHLFQMLSPSIAGIVRWHLDGRLLEVNDTFLNMLGYTRQEFEQQGLNWRALSPEEYQAVDNEAVLQLKIYGHAPAFEKEYLRKDGSRIEVLISNLIIDKANAETGIALILDISKLRANEQQLKEIHRSLLYSQRIARLGSWDYRAETGEVYFSEEFYRIVDAPVGTPFNAREQFLARVHPEDRHRWTQALDAAIQGKKPYSVEYRLLRQDGEIRHVHSQGETFFSEDGRLQRLCGILQDITEQKKFEESLMLLTAQQEALLNNIPDNVWMKDRNLNYIAVNEAGARFLEHPREHVIGRPLSDFVYQEFAERQQQVDRQVFEKGQRITSEDPFIGEDGTKRWFEISRSPIFNSAGELIGMTGVSKDITQRKAYEEAMLRSNELLEKKVKERTQELQAANRTLKENERLRTTFVSSLTHDLRTPLIAQKRLIELLREQCREGDEKIAFLSQGLMENNENLLDMVGKLLETYQYAEGRIVLQVECFDLHGLVEECCDTLKEMALSKEITLINKVPQEFASLVADPSLIRRVLINLLGNAIENIPQGCRVEVDAGLQADTVQIEVSDDGPGIEPEFIPHMFDRYSPRSRRRQKLGSGLGLFICKAIVELHEGSITVKSELGKGATFRIRLPLQNRETLSKAPKSTTSRKR